MPPTKRNPKKATAAVISDTKPTNKIIEDGLPEYDDTSKNEELKSVLLEKRSTRPILSRGAKSKVGKYTPEIDSTVEIETKIKKRKTSSKEPKTAIIKLPSKNVKESIQNDIPKKKLKVNDDIIVEEKLEEQIPNKIKPKSADLIESEKSAEDSNDVISTEGDKKVLKGKNKKNLSKEESDNELPKKKIAKITKPVKKTGKRNDIVTELEASESENVLSEKDANEVEESFTEKVVKEKIKKISKDKKIKSDSKKNHNDDNFQKEVNNLEKEEIEDKKAEEIAEVDMKSVTEKPDADDFDSEKPSNFKITSWNVSGLRAWIKKAEMSYFTKENPDIICFQEIKCTEDQVPDEARLPGYHPYWLGSSSGHAGVAIYSKRMPLNVEYGIGNKEFDSESRIIIAEYNKFYLLNVYVPNAGRKLVTLPKRLEWNILFEKFIENLNKKKPVIICGDMNVAHEEIDLANPKANKRNAGFTQEERNGMSNMLSLGFVDTFRNLYPNVEKAYTFWSYMKNARAKNIGWRLDYFIVSERFLPKVVDNKIRSSIMGSDHCPITLFLNV